MSSDNTRLFFKVSGTSPLTMRCAKPSTMAVLPTPGSPISTGLFLVRRCKICITRRISSSRPITGSSLPAPARSVRSVVYFFKASRAPSASGLCTPSPPRTALIACSSAGRTAPLCFNKRPVSPLSCVNASKNISDATNWSPRFCASLSVTLSKLLRSRDTFTSPLVPSTLGSRSIACASAPRNAGTFAPARPSSEVVPPSCC